jgi:hypothetical protein
MVCVIFILSILPILTIMYPAESHEFDTFDIPDALNPDLPTNPAFFLNCTHAVCV